MNEPTYCSGCADAARLRLVFREAIDNYPYHLSQFLSKEGEMAFRKWWGKLYEAVRDTQAGLALLSELSQLRETIKEVTHESS